MNKTTKTVLATLGIGALLAVLAAFTVIYNDQEIWEVVAFMRASPNVKAADYDALDRRVAPKNGTR